MEIMTCLNISYVEEYISHHYDKKEFQKKQILYLLTINLIVKNPVGNRFDTLFMLVYMFIQA